MALFSSLIIRQLNKHAPIKNKRVKTKRMPYWFTPDIRQMQKLRDNCKRKKQWTEYKKYRNKTRQLIRASKRKHFSESISKSKDTKHIWAHLRTLNGDSNLVSSQLVPKSTRTLVNSYPFLVNSYLTFGQLVPTPSQLVPESKNGVG